MLGAISAGLHLKWVVLVLAALVEARFVVLYGRLTSYLLRLESEQALAAEMHTMICDLLKWCFADRAQEAMRNSQAISLVDPDMYAAMFISGS